MTHDVPATNDELVAELLKAMVDEGMHTPKYQVERAISPFLQVYMEKAVEDFLCGLDEMKGVDLDIKYVCPEFPLRKDFLDVNGCRSPSKGVNQSTNIDFLLVEKKTGTVILVELKTNIGSSRDTQNEIYQRWLKSKAIGQDLVDSLSLIYESTSQKHKYAYLVGKVCSIDDSEGIDDLKLDAIKDWREGGSERRPMSPRVRIVDELLKKSFLAGCSKPMVLYLAPKGSEKKLLAQKEEYKEKYEKKYEKKCPKLNFKFLSLGDFAETEGLPEMLAMRLRKLDAQPD